MKRLNNIYFLIASSCMASTCVAQSSDNAKNSLAPAVEKIAAGQQCNLSDSPSARWINSQQQLTSTLKQMHSHMINAKVSVPKVDFTQAGIVAISMGMQRSGGYGLELSKSPLTIKDHNATLKLNWRQPGKGMISTQVITSPCLLVKINKGDFNYLRIVNLTGKEIAGLPVR